MVSCCNRRLYKGNSYEICLPITDTGVTSVRFYTSGDMVIEKEGEIVDDTMCFELTKEELDLLPDGVLRYSYEGFDSNTEYVIVTPADYSGSTLDDLLEDAFDSGYTAGQEDCSGGTINNQHKIFQIDGNNAGLWGHSNPAYSFMSGGTLIGNVTVTPDSGYTGLEDVQIFMWLPADEAIAVGYQSGYTDGLEACSGSSCNLSYQTINLDLQVPIVYNQDTMRYEISGSTPWSKKYTVLPLSGYDGMALLDIVGSIDGYYAYVDGFDKGQIAGAEGEKAKLTYTAFTRNGYYSRSNGGWSGISIQVPQTGHTDQEMQDNWDSGYTSGKTDGYESGYTAGQESCSGGSWEDGYDSGYTDGQASVDCTDYYNSGVTDGFGSGYTSGYTDGLNACTGYTQEDLDAAFASGWSAGYDSGLTDCSGDTPSAATAITISVPQNLKPGDTGSTSVSTSPQDAPTNLSYSSSDNSVATVDNNGNITAIGTGTTNICVTDSISQITECTQLTITEPEPVYSGIALTFDVISGGSIVWTANRSGYTPTIQYSKNGGSSWTNITASTGGTSISVNAGDKVLFRGNNPSYKVDDYEYAHFYHTTAVFNLEGNIMSLVDSTGFTTATTVSEYAFYKLFWHCDGLKSAENLVLPATTLATGCYQGMFSLCRGLTKAPKLQATAIAANCYQDMFSNCSSLAIAPELPATTLAEGCYWCMFSACTSLTAAPELNALTFKNYCYECMFNGCTNLNYIKCLGYGEINAVANATNNWVKGVATYGTFVKHPNMDIGQVIPPGTYWLRGNGGIPTYWTVEDAQS